MRWLKIAVVVGLVASGMAVTPASAATVQETFIAKLVPAAQDNERKTGIPASVAIGMAALETGWGRSSMAGKYTTDPGTAAAKVYDVNTLFNIKCTATVSPYQTGCVPVKTAEYRQDGTQYFVVAKFRTYASWGDSLLDYGRLLTGASRYAKAFDFKQYPDQFVTEVHKGGYATDPAYAKTVISIMGKYGLYRYNVGGGQPGLPSGLGAANQTTASFPALTTGSRGSSVVTLQRLLVERGAARSLVADGVFGAKTKAAVVAFQKSSGLSATGVLDDATWKVLLPKIKASTSGGAVTALQYELREEGYSVPVAGRYDATTVNAVKAFQKANKLAVDGIVGPLTWAALVS